MTKIYRNFKTSEEKEINDFLKENPFSTLSIFSDNVSIIADQDFINSERMSTLRTQLKEAYTRIDSCQLNIDFAKDKIEEIKGYPEDKKVLKVKGKVVEGKILDEAGKETPKDNAVAELEQQIIANQGMISQANIQIVNIENLINQLED